MTRPAGTRSWSPPNFLRVLVGTVRTDAGPGLLVIAYVNDYNLQACAEERVVVRCVVVGRGGKRAGSAGHHPFFGTRYRPLKVGFCFATKDATAPWWSSVAPVSCIFPASKARDSASVWLAE